MLPVSERLSADRLTMQSLVFLTTVFESPELMLLVGTGSGAPLGCWMALAKMSSLLLSGAVAVAVMVMMPPAGKLVVSMPRRMLSGVRVPSALMLGLPIGDRWLRSGRRR